MILKVFLFSIIFFNTVHANCNWCLSESKNEIASSEQFLNLSPQNQLKKLENEGIKVLILSADRVSNAPFFQWKSIRIDQGKLTDISKLEGSLGKTLCKGERPLATSEYNIILSADAPLSTLLHEYLHVKQIKKDKSWCKVSRNLWSEDLPTPDEIRTVRDHEWDVRKILWALRMHKAFNIEDRIVIAEGMIKESQMRKDFDPAASDFVKKENVDKFLVVQVEEFKKVLMKQVLK